MTSFSYRTAVAESHSIARAEPASPGATTVPITRKERIPEVYAPLTLLLVPLALAAIVNAASLYAGDDWLTWKQVQGVTLGATALSAIGGIGLLCLMLANPHDSVVVLGDWFQIGGKPIQFALNLDPLSAVMVALVSVIGFVICRFSINYMHNETGFTRYFAVYAMALLAMLVVVLADNLIVMFLGWEAVGLCSYLLIGHYADRRIAARSATEAFITNRIGDAGILFGIIVLLAGAGTVRFSELPAAVAAAESWVVNVAAASIALGILSKSAQFPLGGWLAKAMDGPTPSSALNYGATTVTAGVYLLVRSHSLFDAAPVVLTVIGVLGALTVLYGALAGQTSNDIKGLLAASTMMHMGLIFVACGIGAYGVAIFYAGAHAIHKVYKFLTAPSILHHLHGRSAFAGDAKDVPFPSGVAVALLVSVGLVLLPPVLEMTTSAVSLSTSLAVVAAGAILSLALLVWLAVKSVRLSLPTEHANHHGIDGHDHHAHGHGHDDAGNEPKAATGLGPAGAAAITVILAAVGGVVLQLVPGGAEGLWFHRFLGLPEGDIGPAVPGLSALLALMLALIALHSVVSAVLFGRHIPDQAMLASPYVRATYALASNRFWLDGVIQSVIVPKVMALSERLGRFDYRASQFAQDGVKAASEKTGSAVGWLDTVPRKAAESLPSIVGLHMSEAGQQLETQATSGFENSLAKSSGSIGRVALTVERTLGRPVVSVGLIVMVTLIALIGA